MPLPMSETWQRRRTFLKSCLELQHITVQVLLGSVLIVAQR